MPIHQCRSDLLACLLLREANYEKLSCAWSRIIMGKMMLREIFRIECLPVLQNKVYSTKKEAEGAVTGEVVLVQDENTGLIYNAAFDPGLIQYDENYQNEQAFSEAFRRHLDDVSGIIERNFSGCNLLEVGCGKGYFLEHLKNKGFSIKGIDPAYEGSDPDILKAPFEPGSGVEGDAIVLRHVLEHIQDPLGFLGSIASANGGKGLIYIEVPCFDWICTNRAWFDIFYEHVNYFRLADFYRMFGSVVEAGYVFNRQYLYVVAELASLRMPTRSGVTEVVMPPDFLDGIKRVENIANSNQKNVVWGASSKGVIFSIYMARHGIELGFAVDINPAKQGRYLASTGLMVKSPEHAFREMSEGDRIFIMNSNYLSEIVACSGNRYSYYEVQSAAILS